MKFVDRMDELKTIRERLDSNSFELIIVYGKRRIGKTRLVLEAVKDKEHIYYLAVEGDNLRHFKRVASKVVPSISYSQEDWEAYFNFLKDKIIVIDEFPNLIKEDPKIVSLLQRIVDLILSGTNTKLIILGSSISMMSDKVLSYKSPLYGRRTASLKLKPLNFFHLREFFPRVQWEELVEIYGFADGIPYYLEKVSPPFWKWLERELKKPDTFLKDELDFLMKYEFTDSTTYKRILEAIALGRNTPKEIRESIGAKHSDITQYLKNLIDTEFIVKKIPVTENERSRKGRYFIGDNFVTFWFRYIYPNLSSIEEGIFDIEEIKEDYTGYLGTIFEDVARQFLIELNKRGMLPLRFSKIGGWWHKGDEIDLVALDMRERKALLVEVKWKDLGKKEIHRILENLRDKTELIGLDGYEIYHGVVARKTSYKNGLVWDLRDFSLVA
ncbi:putative ATPase {AAA+ superfamily} [Geoglobus ahangari]|uniref:Putative ATPase (AAA+ superfamily) n=1 Tax=Geoglobus ahangari TaxID=113653 RepID=A0A0F7IF03_9EURY|nr:ATP-binding protein [Geoglobus ahangari]AKG91285.1 putative ATPase {AAA+ superfamily} [Geoglobus ahangari]